MKSIITLSILILQISCGNSKEFELTKSSQETRSFDARAHEKKDSILLQGFDKLSNSSKEKCLKEDRLELQVLEMNEGSSDVLVFESLSELANSLKLGLGISGGSIEHWNEEPSHVWIKRLSDHFENMAWLNPVPDDHWDYTSSICILRDLFEIW